jgi:hypothetical protein
MNIPFVRDDNPEEYGPEETEQRLRKLMRGAFAGPPTQMKNIPRKRPKATRRKAKSPPKS